MSKHLLKNGNSLKEEVITKSEINSNTGCWLWKGAKDKNGYGTRRIGSRGNSKNWFAHRLSAYLWLDNYSEDLNVNHHCDVPSCVNPNHLYMGTQQDNMKDMQKRKRRLGKESPKIQGDNHPSARLTEQDVKAIREFKKDGGVMRQLWREVFPHVSYSTILMAASGDNWKYVK